MEVVAIIFAAITVWVVAPMLIFGRRKRHAELSSGEKKRLVQLEAENAKNEERLRNLETIVCDVDLELNAKLNRLATATRPALQISAEAHTVDTPGTSGGTELASTKSARHRSTSSVTRCRPLYLRPSSSPSSAISRNRFPT